MEILVAIVIVLVIGFLAVMALGMLAMAINLLLDILGTLFDLACPSSTDDC